MSKEMKAVFLSYASQDLVAARRICDALRAAGVEVWFDQSELRGGDAWDAKIRKQIRECALFVPVISANTQARGEGYFRLEWKLAVDRSHLLAEDQPFFVPVSIDGTKDGSARVPAEFLKVQWSRLAMRAEQGAGSTEQGMQAFIAQVQRLLGPADTVAGGDTRPQPNPIARKRAPTLAVAAIVLVLLTSTGWFWFSRSPNSPLPSAATPTAELLSEAKKLVRQAQALLLTTELGISELNTAALICEKAIVLDKSDAEAWATASEVETAKIQYGRDGSNERRESARIKAATALSLDARSFEARRAKSYYLVVVQALRQGDRKALEEAEPILRALRAERPHDGWTLLVLGLLLSVERTDESAAVFDEMARLPGLTAIAFSEKAWILSDAGRWAEADSALDRSIAVQPFTGNVGLKVILATRWRGDGDLALATLDKLPPSMLIDDRGLSIAVAVYRWRREPDRLLELMSRIPRDWTTQGPTAALTGDAHALLGQPAAAKNDWQRALVLVDERLAQAPNDPTLLGWRGYLLDALGEKIAAAKVMSLLGEIAAPPLRFGILTRYDRRSRMSSAENMLDAVEAGVRSLQSLFYTPASLRFDPAYDNVRATPRFQAALALAEASYPKPISPGAK